MEKKYMSSSERAINCLFNGKRLFNKSSADIVKIDYENENIFFQYYYNTMVSKYNTESKILEIFLSPYLSSSTLRRVRKIIKHCSDNFNANELKLSVRKGVIFINGVAIKSKDITLYFDINIPQSWGVVRREDGVFINMIYDGEVRDILWCV